MNRFKKELRKQGVKFECDYSYMPYDLGTHSLEWVIVNSERCTVTYITTAITLTDYYDTSMNVYKQEWD